MKILLGLNVLLDVIQRREPHYGASAGVLSRVLEGEIDAAVPAHAVTTVHYIVARFAGRQRAATASDWLLGALDIHPEDREIFLRARSLPMRDFEDAVVAAVAEASDCDHIITRNVGDFGGSPVEALSPAELEATLDAVAE